MRERRLTWLEHLVRLHPETPEGKALKEHLREVKRPQGRPKTTWMQKEGRIYPASELNLIFRAKTLDTLSRLTHDRKTWRWIVRRVVQY